MGGGAGAYKGGALQRNTVAPLAMDAPLSARYRTCQFTPSMMAAANGAFTRNHLVRPVQGACTAEAHEHGYGYAYCLDHLILLGICTYGDFCTDAVVPGAYSYLCARHTKPPSVVTIYVDEEEEEEEVRAIPGVWRVPVGQKLSDIVAPQPSSPPAKKVTPPRPAAAPPAPKKARSNVARISSQPQQASLRLQQRLASPEMLSDDEIRVQGVLSVICN
jgi:hypothetical protein